MLEELTAYRNAKADALALQAWAQGLTKQNDELRAKVAEGEKKLAEANAEINELKGLGKAPAAPEPQKPPQAGSKKPGEFYNENGTVKQVPK